MTMTLVVVVLLAVALLPSALNIPQSNPNTVPEYAPVPPDEESQTSESGNLAALGQARGSSLARGPGTEPVPIPTAVGERRGGKKCVGNPPRQSEDPMSPPCVAFFEGNNGGATYQGVTGNEITVVVHFDGDASYDNGEGGVEDSPVGGSFCDLDKAPNAGGPGCSIRGTDRDHFYTRFARAFARHFNDRYQTYGRHVHFWIYWGRLGQGSVEGRRSAAQEAYARLRPFAMLNQTTFSLNRDAFTDAMIRRNVLFFGGQMGLRAAEPYPASFFQKYDGKAWSFTPDIEHWANAYSDYICTKMPPGSTVRHATGGVGTDGQPFDGRQRKFGFISTSDPGYPGVRQFADTAAAQLKAKCGIDPGPDERVKYSLHGFACCASPEESTQNMARLKAANVTTLIWLGGVEMLTSRGAQEVKYFPEVIYAGDGSAERNTVGRLQDQDFVRNAVVLSHQLRYLSPQESYAMQVCREDQALTRANCDLAISFFREYYMLFKAIQAAGPRLTPTAIDRGFHAIPRISSTHPDLASCFFDPGDYTCVKDYTEMWWDGAGRVPSHGSVGCFRLVKQGRRVLPGDWTPSYDLFDTNDAPCSAFQGGGVLDGA